MANIKDLIYFDFEKATSLFSQFEGGLLQQTQDATETKKDERNIRKYEIPFFKPEFGGVEEEKISQFNTKILHHDLLIRLEHLLFSANYGLDLNNIFDTDSPVASELHSKLLNASYVRANGWAIIDDFKTMKKMSGQFNKLNEFIGRCAFQELKQSDEYAVSSKELDDARKRVNEIKDRNKRAKEDKKIQKLEKQFLETIKQATGLSGIDEWLADGIGFFIDLFMPDRILLSIYPFENLPEFQVLANLKRDCFIDSDLDIVIQAYGTRPNVKITVLGVITSIPNPENKNFDPLERFTEHNSDLSTEEEKFEMAFRNVFSTFEGFYKFIRYSRYPNITVHPLAVYRNIGS